MRSRCCMVFRICLAWTKSVVEDGTISWGPKNDAYSSVVGRIWGCQGAVLEEKEKGREGFPRSIALPGLAALPSSSHAFWCLSCSSAPSPPHVRSVRTSPLLASVCAGAASGPVMVVPGKPHRESFACARKDGGSLPSEVGPRDPAPAPPSRRLRKRGTSFYTKYSTSVRMYKGAIRTCVLPVQ